MLYFLKKVLYLAKKVLYFAVFLREIGVRPLHISLHQKSLTAMLKSLITMSNLVPFTCCKWDPV